LEIVDHKSDAQTNENIPQLHLHFDWEIPLLNGNEVINGQTEKADSMVAPQSTVGLIKLRQPLNITEKQ